VIETSGGMDSAELETSERVGELDAAMMNRKIRNHSIRTRTQDVIREEHK
jgi:hypothetical protein